MAITPSHLYQGHHAKLEEILVTSDSTRRSFASKLYTERLITEKVMDTVHKERREDDFLAEYLLRELRGKFESHLEDILKVMETEECLREIAWTIKEQYYGMISSNVVMAPLVQDGSITSDNPAEMPIYNLQRRISETAELAIIARQLQNDFNKLIIIISKSLKNIDIDEFKMSLNLYLDDALTVSCSNPNTIRKYIEQIESFNSVTKIITFLKSNHFIGYLNYMLLKELLTSFLSQDNEVFKSLDVYESECIQLLNKTSFRNLIELCGEYPQLSPRVVTGLPEIWFKMDESWEDKTVGEFDDKFKKRFNWFSCLCLKSVDNGCVLVTFVVWKLKEYRIICQELTDTIIINQLSKEGITVTIEEHFRYKQLYGAISIGDVVHVISLLKEERFDINIKFKYDMCQLSNSESLLHLAVDTGQHSSLQTLINFKVDVNITDQNGKTPLYYAIRSGYNDMVKTLLEHGAKIDKNGGSYIHYFVEHNQVKAIEDLLSSGQADGNLSDKFGDTPLHFAIKSNHLEVIEVLLSHRVNTTIENKQGQSPLYLAAVEGKQNIFSYLLDNGVNPYFTDKNNYTYLHRAASNGEVTAADLFIRNTVDQINAIDKNYRTPLHLAVESGHKEMTKFLLQNGAQVDVKDTDGKAAIHYAADNGHSDIIEILMIYKADINIVDKELRTPLHLSAANDDVTVVQTLLNWGADGNKKANDGWTPLTQAAWSGHDAILKELLVNDSSMINTPDNGGCTPIQIATSRGHSQIVQRLIQYGADYSVVYKGDWSLLHVAAQRGHPNTVKVLLEKGFDVNIQDINGWSAFNTSLVKAHPDVARIMMEHGAIVDLKEKKDGKTSIHHAVDSLELPGRYSVVKLLLDHEDVDPNAVDNDGLTPLHYAVDRESSKLVQLLLEKGADYSLKDKYGETPVDYANGNKEILKIFNEFRK